MVPFSHFEWVPEKKIQRIHFPKTTVFLLFIAPPSMTHTSWISCSVSLRIIDTQQACRLPHYHKDTKYKSFANEANE